MKNIDAGDLRHRVTLKRNAPTSVDAVGQSVPDFTTIGTYYALAECLGGSEVVNASQKKGILRYRVTLRAASGPILPADVLLWNGHTLKVDSATPDPFGILIEVIALEYGVQ